MCRSLQNVSMYFTIDSSRHRTSDETVSVLVSEPASYSNSSMVSSRCSPKPLHLRVLLGCATLLVRASVPSHRGNQNLKAVIQSCLTAGFGGLSIEKAPRENCTPCASPMHTCTGTDANMLHWEPNCMMWLQESSQPQDVCS